MLKKLISLLISACMLFCLVGCDNGTQSNNIESSITKTSSKNDLYSMGLEITKIMNEMVQSEEFASIMGVSDFSDVIKIVDTNDYDSPIAIYSIEMPKIKDLFALFNVSEMDVWSSLSNNLQKQLENRINFGSIISIINSQHGSSELAFSSSYIASDYFDTLNVDKQIIYLYVFEKGTPIVVTFSKKGYVSGQFLFSSNMNSLSDVRSVFEPYQCAVDSVNIEWYNSSEFVVDLIKIIIPFTISIASVVVLLKLKTKIKEN